MSEENKEESTGIDIAEAIEGADDDIASFAAKEVKRSVWKPDLDDFEDMIAPDGTLLVDEGEFIVMQYPEIWRSTAIWKILHIRENGNMILIAHGATYHSMTNWKVGPERGIVFKIYDPKIKLSTRKTTYIVEQK